MCARFVPLGLCADELFMQPSHSLSCSRLLACVVCNAAATPGLNCCRLLACVVCNAAATPVADAPGGACRLCGRSSVLRAHRDAQPGLPRGTPQGPGCNPAGALEGCRPHLLPLPQTLTRVPVHTPPHPSRTSILWSMCAHAPSAMGARSILLSPCCTLPCPPPPPRPRRRETHGTRGTP